MPIQVGTSKPALQAVRRCQIPLTPRSDQHRKRLRQRHCLWPPRQRQKIYVPTAASVQAYVGLGDYDEAFAWFERAYQDKCNILQWIKVEPFPDAMRNDPRFADLLHRVGLDQAR